MRTDLSRRVAELASEMVLAALDQVQLDIFAGPRSGVLSRQEALAQLETPEQRAATGEKLGVDNLIEQAQQLTDGVGE